LYLGNTAKARYYFERHSRGKYEAPFSALKKIYQQKHLDKFNALKLKEKVTPQTLEEAIKQRVKEAIKQLMDLMNRD
jgi:hypothetical protein